MCVFRRATSLFTWGFPRHTTPDASQHCTLHCSLLRGCIAESLALGTVALCLQPTTGSPAQQDSARHSSKNFSSLESHVRWDISPLPLQNKTPKAYTFVKTYSKKKKKISDTSKISRPCGSLCVFLGSCLVPPDGFNGQDWGSPCPICLPWPLAGSHLTQNLMSGLAVLSKAFSRHRPVNWIKLT